MQEKYDTGIQSTIQTSRFTARQTTENTKPHGCNTKGNDWLDIHNSIQRLGLSATNQYNCNGKQVPSLGSRKDLEVLLKPLL